MTGTATEPRTRTPEIIGTSVARPDVPPKIDGSFEFSNDVSVPGMLFGATIRSPHPRARIVDLDMAEALTAPGVVRILTLDDVPTPSRTGHIVADEPVFVDGEARYVGEPVAFVVARSQEQAWRAADLVRVEWEVLEPVCDPDSALAADAPLVHPAGNIIRELVLRRGEPDGDPVTPLDAEVVVEGIWETGRQDQAFLGPESALALPDVDGGVTLVLATQDLHTDQHQIAAVLGLEQHLVRLVMSGIGGAFGGREDITCQVHLALAALSTGRPVKTTYRRAESFLAHPKRHPARMRYRLGADRDGRFRFVEADLVLDGGPYASTSGPVLGSACYFAAGPYRIPTVRIRGRSVRTNNPVSGAMRGFGAVQACFGIESTVDLLAAELGIDPVEIRRRNVLGPGDEFPTSGQRVGPSAPLLELIDRCTELPLPDPLPSGNDADPAHPYLLPGGTGLTSDGTGVRRGTGFALGVKNHLYGEGVPEWSLATVTITPRGAMIRSAAAEVGQGIGSALVQIASATLGGMPAELEPATTEAGYAGSSSASRQTWMSGAAVRQAAAEAGAQLIGRLADATGVPPDEIELVPDGVLVAGEPWPLATAVERLGDPITGGGEIAATSEYRAPGTHRGDPTTGQGDVHVSWMFVAHRAVVDVDVELGLCRVVQIATAQDVGRALNPREVRGQILGGIAQGIGLALNEHLATTDGRVLNNSFTDYLLPTAADVPEVAAVLVEVPDPDAPFGLKGAGEPSALSSTASIAAAVRDATGRRVERVPITPDDLVG